MLAIVFQILFGHLLSEVLGIFIVEQMSHIDSYSRLVALKFAVLDYPKIVQKLELAAGFCFQLRSCGCTYKKSS
jgi:hypothetical protein